MTFGEGLSMDRSGYDTPDEHSLFSFSETEAATPMTELELLIHRFKTEGPNTMTDGEMTIIDQAVEDGLITEDSLRSSTHAA